MNDKEMAILLEPYSRRTKEQLNSKALRKNRMIQSATLESRSVFVNVSYV